MPDESTPSHIVLREHLERLWGAAEQLHRHIPDAAAYKGTIEDSDWPWNHEKYRAELRHRGFSEADIRAEFSTGWKIRLAMLNDANKQFWRGLDGALHCLNDRKSLAEISSLMDSQLPTRETWTFQLRKILNGISPLGISPMDNEFDANNMLRTVVAAIQRGAIQGIQEPVYRQLDSYIFDLRALPANVVAKDVAKARENTPALHPDDRYLPAGWFKQEAGIDSARLRMAARRTTETTLPTIGKGKAKKYHLATAKALWPQDFEGLATPQT